LQPEILAPAGNLEKLRIALAYGADAVYGGGQAYSLRALADNFTAEQLHCGIALAHRQGARFYVTANIFAHEMDLKQLPQYLESLAAAGADALIVSDPGIIRIAGKVVPELPLHLSTQANCLNSQSALLWAELGVKRIILARELHFEEIKALKAKLPAEIELEMFVHGSMCLSYSGRCWLSAYLAQRDANRGLCAHPCRWQYALLEEKRPGEYFPVLEDQRGAYIMNSQDLCLIEELPALTALGIASFKIEGRMKGVHYVATTTRAYRQVRDACLAGQNVAEKIASAKEELKRTRHRPYTTGFLWGEPEQNPARSYEKLPYNFVGVALGEGSKVQVEVRNHLAYGQRVEILRPNLPTFQQPGRMFTEDGSMVEAAHANQIVVMEFVQPVEKYSLIRLAEEEGQ
jgi:putative protease